MVAVRARGIGCGNQPVALDFFHGLAHGRRHPGEPGLGAGLGVHRLDVGDHARALRRVVLTLGFLKQE